MTKTCYMCDMQKTSVEHTPPKCLFPEGKDISSGLDYRKNLITVPSCENHNSAKSNDDEYLLYILSASITSSNVGMNQFLQKVKRSYERNPSLMTKLIKTHVPITIQDKSNKTIKTIGFEVQMDRIQDSLDKVARALYFYETGTKHKGATSVVEDFTINLYDKNLNCQKQSLFNSVDKLLSNLAHKGSNPEVFKYRIASYLSNAVVEMVFYGDARAIAVLG